jgi:choline-glycine betaine transporter
MMEHKWYMIMVAVAVVAMMASLAVSEYGRSNCQLELGKAGRSAEDIAKICR